MRALVILPFIIAVSACATDRQPDKDTRGTEPATRTAQQGDQMKPASQPSSRPVTSRGEGPAYDLARRIGQAAGAEKLTEVAQLNFQFAVYKGDTKVFVADHRWDRLAGRARISWTDKDGRAIDAVLDTQDRSVSAKVNSQPAPADATEEIAKAAYGRYINDVYWLLLPLKLLDPGTQLELLAPETVGGTEFQVLKISFDNVGLTPGDVYHLYVDTKTNQIRHWKMLLQGRADKPSMVTWEDYQSVGPLMLAIDHRMADGRRIVFEGTRALTEVNASDFRP